MNPVQISHAFRLLILLCCVLLLPSCKVVNGIVKLPVNIVKSAARTVGLSNLTDHPAQPVSKDSASDADTETLDLGAASRKLD